MSGSNCHKQEFSLWRSWLIFFKYLCLWGSCERFPSAVLMHYTSRRCHTCLLLYIFNARSVFTLCDAWYLLAHASLFHFSLPAVQYPSPLHGHRWITRPGLAQLTECCYSSENTPLPSYSNGLSAGCPRRSPWCTIEGKGERCRRKEGGRRGGAEVRLRWADETKRVAIVSRGNRDANSETLCRHRNLII